MFGQNLAKLRKGLKLSQYDLAERMGFSRGQVANYEQGTRQPDFETLQKFADFFDVSTDYLLGRSDQKNSSADYQIKTIAAHHDGDEWTEEELDEIERFKEFVRMKRGNKQQE